MGFRKIPLFNGKEGLRATRRSGYIPCPLRGKGLGESGGASLKGKGGRVGFRKIPLFNGKEGQGDFRKIDRVIRKIPLFGKRNGVIRKRSIRRSFEPFYKFFS